MTTEKLEACYVTSLIVFIFILVAILLAGCTQTIKIKGIDAISPVGVEFICDLTVK